MTIRKDLPAPADSNFLARMREEMQVMMGHRGGGLDKAVTLADLVEGGVVKLKPIYMANGRGSPIAGIGSGVPTGAEPELDLTPPPVPDGFAATTSKTNIQVTTNPPTYRQGGGHARTIVYGAKYTPVEPPGPLPTFANAVVLTEFNGDVHAFPVDPASTYRLWIKWKTVDGVESVNPAGGINGVLAAAGLLDDANIVSLNASKIKAGALSVGEYIQSANYVALTSGWRISSNGVIDAQAGVFRGTVFARLGLIGGNQIDATGMQSPDYDGTSGWRLSSNGLLIANNAYLRGALNGGAYTGYAWPAVGTGFHISAEGLLLGNVNTGRYFNVAGNGDVFAPGFSIAAGAATFNGSVTAQNFSTVGGRFTADTAGNVVADNVDIRRRIVLQTGQFDPSTAISLNRPDGTPGQPGDVIRILLLPVALTAIYDANGISAQPYSATAACVGGYRETVGVGTNIVHNVVVGARVIFQRAFTNTGQFPDDNRMVIVFDLTVTIVSGVITSFRIPLVNWTVFRL